MHRYWSLVCVALSMSASLQAKIVVAEQKSFSLFLRLGSPTQVRETRTFSCPAGPQHIVLTKLPRNIQESSLLVQMRSRLPVTVKERSVHNNTFTYEEMLQSAVGTSVMMMKDGSPYKKATLLAVDDKNKPIVLHDGIIDFQPPPLALLPEKETTGNQPALAIEMLNPEPQECTCILYYLCPLILWKVHYLIDIDPRAHQLVMQGYVTLRNLCGIPLKNVSVFWMPTQDIWAKAFEMSASIDLPHQQKQTVPFFKKLFTPKLSYHLSMPTTLSQNASHTKLPVRQHFSLPKEALDLHRLPNGEVTVYVRQSQEVPVHFLSKMLKKEDSALDIPMEIVPFLYGSLVYTQKRGLNNRREEVTYYIKITNTSDKPAIVQLEQPLEKEWDFTQGHSPPLLRNATGLLWSLTIPAKDVLSFWFRLTKPERADIPSKESVDSP